MTRDRRLLCAAAFVRAAATKYAAVVLGLFLATTRIDASVTSAGLLGVALATLVVTWAGARLPPRTTVFTTAILGAVGALVLAGSGTWIPGDMGLVAGAACFVGMINAMGRDRSPSLAVETALLPSTTTDAGRTQAFAWHSVMQDGGHALGGLLAAAVPWLFAAAAGAAVATDGDAAVRAALATHDAAPLRMGLAFYGALLLAAAVPYLLLSRELAAPPPRPRVPLSPEGRRILVRVCALFGLDGLGGGFLATSLMTYFFHERFHVSGETIGLLTAAGSALNAVSHFGAAWLARRIGLVRTMVFTHIPSSVLLATVPFAPSFGVAAALYLVREGLVEMDVPTRQSYVMAVLRPEERTFASGATLLVRLFAYIVGPLVAAPFLATGDPADLAVPLWIGAGTKILYDVLLWRSFRARPPPEERERT